jgi:hypothetical protein
MVVSVVTDSRDVRDLKGSQARRVLRELPARPVRPGLTDSQAYPGRMGLPARTALATTARARRYRPVGLLPRAAVVRLVQRGTRATRVTWGLLVLKVPLASKGRKGFLVRKGNLDHLAHKVHRECRDWTLLCQRR